MKLTLLTLTLLLSAQGLAESPDWPDIDGAVQPRAEWLVTGQPQPHELVALRDAGVIHVFNARGEDEFDAWDQSALLESLGMIEHRLPIAGAGDLDREAVEAFDRFLAELGDQPALMHCASGNRVGALFALRAGWLHGEDIDTALDIGRQHGLTRLEPAVREKLEAD